jgi:hypothetical protein
VLFIIRRVNFGCRKTTTVSSHDSAPLRSPEAHNVGMDVHSMEAVMRIPKDIQIPFIVLSLEAVLLTGAALIFLMLRPG